MLNRIKDIVTWGGINVETLEKLLRNNSTLDGGLTEEIVLEETDYDSVNDFAEAVLDGKVDFAEVDGLKNLFRLHPPIGGYRSVKKPFNTGGSLGYRGKEINNLLQKMVGPEAEKSR